MPHRQPPPQPPYQHPYNLPPPSQPPLHNLPDFLLTALSLLLFISSPKHHLSPRHPSPPLTLSSSSTTITTNRRFLRLTATMPLTPKLPTSTHFPTPQSLSDWLKPRLPSDSFSTWGTTPGTKNIHNLWLELADGETSLLDATPPVRNLEVVSVRVLPRNSDKRSVLVESHQELSDGSVRKRGRPLSEKLKAGEGVEAAVKRAVKEELGSVIYDKLGTKEVDFAEIVEVVEGSYVKKVEERSSVSYPGLPACYVMHHVEAYVEGLPEGEFVTEEEEEEYGEVCDSGRVASEAIKCKKHFWKWVPVDSL